MVLKVNVRVELEAKLIGVVGSHEEAAACEWFAHGYGKRTDFFLLPCYDQNDITFPDTIIDM